MHTSFRLLLAVIAAASLATALTHAQPRIEPIRPQVATVPLFDTIDIARGSFHVAGPDDVFARHMGIGDLLTRDVQVTERLQLLPVSGGVPARARYVCTTFEGVLFAADGPCETATPPPPIDRAR